MAKIKPGAEEGGSRRALPGVGQMGVLQGRRRPAWRPVVLDDVYIHYFVDGRRFCPEADRRGARHPLFREISGRAGRLHYSPRPGRLRARRRTPRRRVSTGWDPPGVSCRRAFLQLGGQSADTARTSPPATCRTSPLSTRPGPSSRKRVQPAATASARSPPSAPGSRSARSSASRTRRRRRPPRRCVRHERHLGVRSK